MVTGHIIDDSARQAHSGEPLFDSRLVDTVQMRNEKVMHGAQSGWWLQVSTL